MHGNYHHSIIFDRDASEQDVAAAVISVANAAKTAVETTALQLATTEHADYRAHLWTKLERIYEFSAGEIYRVRR